MELAKVIGTVVATEKHTSLLRSEAALIQPMTTTDSQQGLRLWQPMPAGRCGGHSEVDHRPRGRLHFRTPCPRRLCNGRDCGRVLGG